MAYLATHTLEEMNRVSVIASIRAALSRAMTAMQIARMETVLHRMSGDQLRRIGITPAEIPAHARRLVVG